MFSRRNPDETQQRLVACNYYHCQYAVCVCSGGDGDRDVFNEKPSKEEVMAATQGVSINYIQHAPSLPLSLSLPPSLPPPSLTTLVSSSLKMVTAS